MSVTFTAILIASILGSLHCVGMCGGFALYCGSSKSAGLYYHLGRLLTYSILGAISGYLGARIDASAETLGFQKITAILLGSLLILWGGVKLSGVRFPFSDSSTLSKKASRLYQAIFSRFTEVKPKLRSFIVGFLSTLLPCAWLYTFIAVALTSGSPVVGAVMMAVFWVGTLPALLTVGGFGKVVFSRLGKFAPTLSAVLIILAGVASIATHFSQSHQHHSHLGHMH